MSGAFIAAESLLPSWGDRLFAIVCLVGWFAGCALACWVTRGGGGDHGRG